MAELATEVEKAMDLNVLYMKQTSDTSKPIADATNSEVDVVKLLQTYGMVPTEGLGLKHRRPKKVVTEEISMIPIKTLSDVHSTELTHKPLVL